MASGVWSPHAAAKTPPSGSPQCRHYQCCALHRRRRCTPSQAPATPFATPAELGVRLSITRPKTFKRDGCFTGSHATNTPGFPPQPPEGWCSIQTIDSYDGLFFTVPAIRIIYECPVSTQFCTPSLGPCGYSSTRCSEYHSCYWGHSSVLFKDLFLYP